MTEANLRSILIELGVEITHRNGSDWLVCRCPFAALGFHSRGYDSKPSFNAKINPTGVSGFNCFTCEQTGTIGGLVDKIAYHSGRDFGNLSTRARLKELQVEFGDFGASFDDLPPEPLDDAVMAGAYPFAWEEERARSYYQSRGITDESAQIMGLLYHPEELRLLFPVRDQDQRLYGFTGRSVIPDDERTRAVKVKDYFGLSKRWHLLGEELIKINDMQRGKLPIIVVEGLFAYAHLVSIGARAYCNPVATMGAYTSDHQRDRLAFHGRPIHYLYDDDLAGDVGLFGKQNPDGQHSGKGALSLVAKVAPTHLALYPPGHSGDPDDLTLEQLKRIISTDSQLFTF